VEREEEVGVLGRWWRGVVGGREEGGVRRERGGGRKRGEGIEGGGGEWGGGNILVTKVASRSTVPVMSTDCTRHQVKSTELEFSTSVPS
jgi:hypothetical protein